MAHFITSPAPHVHSGDSVRRNMLLVILALMPAYVVSVIEFGLGALIVAAVSVVACVATEWIISRFLLKEKKQSVADLSAVLTGLLLAFNLPSGIDWWIILIGAVVAIGVGKMSFGGLGQNPFNPALVGRVFLLISFPAQMTTWPKPQGFDTVDAETAATPLSFLKKIVKFHDGSAVDQLPNLDDALFGAIGGSFGEVCALALIIGGIFLICTRVITWHQVTVTFPQKFMKKKAQVTMTPVLRYQGGEAAGQSVSFQGEKPQCPVPTYLETDAYAADLSDESVCYSGRRLPRKNKRLYCRKRCGGCRCGYI